MSEIAGEKGMGKAQRALVGASQAGPTKAAKQGVFLATIAANPFRQALIQFHQGVRAFFYNPQLVTSPAMKYATKDYVEYVFTGKVSKEAKPFIDFVESSGVLSAIDKHSLVRGSLLDMTERRTFAGKLASKGASVMQAIGFNAGEMGNMLISAAAVFDRYKRAGKNVLDPVVIEHMHSELRALTYEMNFAGDMPYNQNSAAMFLQFMQVPHKAFLQFTNRNCTVNNIKIIIIRNTIHINVSKNITF